MNRGALCLPMTLAALAGCSSSTPLPPTFTIEPGRYDAAFDAARDVLRHARFNIDRVDAAAGVISTEPKRSSGLATPWDGEQSTARQEFEDLINHQQRTVRITFEPPEGQPGGGAGAPTQLGETPETPGLRRYDGPLTARVLVVIEREHRPGWRLETASISYSSFSQDTSLWPRGMYGSYWVPVAQDPMLERRLAARIAGAIAAHIAAQPIATPAAPPAPAPPTPTAPGND